MADSSVIIRDLAAVIGAVTGIAGLWVAVAKGVFALGALTEMVKALVARVGTLETRDANRPALELKVDELWRFQMRRGFNEAIEKGVATVNSPMNVTPAAREAFVPLIDRLRDLHTQYGNLEDHDFAVWIENKLGELIASEVCPRLGIQEGACLVLAIKLAREPEPEPKPE